MYYLFSPTQSYSILFLRLFLGTKQWLLNFREKGHKRVWGNKDMETALGTVSVFLRPAEFESARVSIKTSKNRDIFRRVSRSLLVWEIKETVQVCIV